MREHTSNKMAGIAGAVFALSLVAGTTEARTSAIHPTIPPPGAVDRKPHNEQGRSAGDGSKVDGLHVAPGYSVRMLAGGLGPCQSAVGSGRGGFDTQIYVLRQATNQVVKIDPAGHVKSFTDLSPVSPEGSCTWPTFDFVGGYGGSLYVQDPTVRTSNVGPLGDTEVFAINHVIDRVGTMKFDHAGSFDGSLYITDSAKGTLYAVDRASHTDLIATGVGGGRSLAVSGGGVMGDALFIGDPASSRILMVGPDHVPGQPAQVFSNLILSAPGMKPAAMDLSKYGPFGRGVLLVGDAATGRIIQLDSQGRRIGELGMGFKNLVSIEIAWAGVFTGKLIVTANGCVYAVEPDCRVDWNGDHEVTPADLADFMSDFSQGDADFDGNGSTDGMDMSSYFAAYSQGCK